MEKPQKHILYVDDSAEDRQMYTHFLTRKGFRVSTAETGTNGLDKAFAQKPDVVVMDLWLPELGGWQVCQCLKTDPRTRHIPVLIITGHSPLRPEVVGCEGMLTKPLPPESLLAEIQRVLESQPSGEKPQP